VRHEALAQEARSKGRALTAAEAYVRAAIYYHCGKHLFAGHPDQWRAAHDSVVRCYAAGAPDLDPPLQRLTFPYRGVEIPGWLCNDVAEIRGALGEPQFARRPAR
jgi:hypothetical protein